MKYEKIALTKRTASAVKQAARSLDVSSEHFHGFRIGLRGRKVRIFTKLSGYHALLLIARVGLGHTHTSVQRGVCPVIRLIDALTQLIKRDPKLFNSLY